jgi:hypothetical protein
MLERKNYFVELKASLDRLTNHSDFKSVLSHAKLTLKPREHIVVPFGFLHILDLPDVEVAVLAC